MRRKPILYLAVLVLALLFLGWLFTDIFIYILISVVLAAILRPLTNLITRIHVFKQRIPRFLAVIMSFAALILFISAFVVLFIPLISEQIQVIGRINYEELYERATVPLQDLEDFMIVNNLTGDEPGFLVDVLRQKLISFISTIRISNILNELLSFTGNFFVGVLAVSFITFFFLYEMGYLRKQLISLIPNKYFEVTIAAFNKIERLLSNYLVGLLIQMFSVFSIAAIGLSILGIKYALTIALFAAVANLIPYLGPILGATFGIIVGVSTGANIVTQQDFLLLVIKIASVFAIVQLIDNIVLQPLIFSKSVKAHPLEIFIIIFAGASLAGIPGMIVAIPVYTVLRVSLGELYTGYRSYKVFRTQSLQPWHSNAGSLDFRT
ncbi:AI-2E family transporter [Fulvivirga sedimenti]|uniref:AI-2E family transporter n=1 Tax=Fulvivirga sedimenti TaxID=2879465 RepID=A0A9X1KZQ0_9BACT|nr:AI-2E family transporter [Fulvivirga sedimenti]MCA6074941.1 AI-2E family transporter [Fulvivirga sedimenti]MCA6076118.1 AI-2E family transporter [Fulvivirga sedimenti]MCA6077246.1 AI-2E family transporter [Fulvivirga sedimenti]